MKNLVVIILTVSQFSFSESRINKVNIRKNFNLKEIEQGHHDGFDNQQQNQIQNLNGYKSSYIPVAPKYHSFWHYVYLSTVKNLFFTIFGVVLLISAVILCWVNEMNYLTDYKTRRFCDDKDRCPSIENVQNLDKKYENNLIIASGKLSTQDKIEDRKMGIQKKNCVIYERTVERLFYIKNQNLKMQYHKNSLEQESEKQQKYVQAWVTQEEYNSLDKEYDPSFQNPSFFLILADKWLYQPLTMYSKAQIGQYKVSQDLLEQLKPTTQQFPTESDLHHLSSDLPKNSFHLQSQEQYIYLHKTKTQSLGDYRISMKYLPDQTVTVLAGIKQGEFAPFDCIKEEITQHGVYKIMLGEQSKRQIFDIYLNPWQHQTYGIRVISLLTFILACITLLFPYQNLFPIYHIPNIAGLEYGIILGIFFAFSMFFLEITIFWSSVQRHICLMWFAMFFVFTGLGTLFALTCLWRSQN